MLVCGALDRRRVGCPNLRLGLPRPPYKTKTLTVHNVFPHSTHSVCSVAPLPSPCRQSQPFQPQQTRLSLRRHLHSKSEVRRKPLSCQRPLRWRRQGLRRCPRSNPQSLHSLTPQQVQARPSDDHLQEQHQSPHPFQKTLCLWTSSHLWTDHPCCARNHNPCTSRTCPSSI